MRIETVARRVLSRSTNQQYVPTINHGARGDGMTTIKAMKQAQHLIRWVQFGECRTYPGQVPAAREVDKLLAEAIAAEESQTQNTSKWPIAGIKVKVDDGYGPNFHLYRLLGANDLEPGEYELFIRPTQAPAVARPINFGTGHCSCVECVCEPVAPDSERAALIAKLRDMPPNPFRLMMWEAADMLAADNRPTQVTCQTYGHVIGACAECNTHE